MNGLRHIEDKQKKLSAVVYRTRSPSLQYKQILRVDTEMQGRIEELADKCTEGRLTPEECDEYEAMIPCRKLRCHSASESSSTSG